MAYPVDPSPSAGVHNDVHTTQQNPLGAVRQFSDGNSYIYLKGVASTAAGDWVVFDETYQTTRTIATSAGPAAIAQAATIASTFGWYLYVGSGTSYVLSAAISAATLYVNAQAGAVSTTVVSNKGILNATTATVSASNSATVRINRPWVGDNTIS